MKKLFFALLSFSFFFQTDSLQAAIDCHVVAKSGDGKGSLPWQIERINQGICGSVIFTLMEAPLKVKLSEPLYISDNYAAMISGADYEVNEPWPPLGVVIDARSFEGCAIYLENPQYFSIKALSFWVKDWDEAICDFQGRSILRKGSPAYVGDALMAKYYSQLQLCEGADQAQSCTMAPLALFLPFPKGPGDLQDLPKPPLPPGPGDLQNVPQPPQPPLPPGPDDWQDCSDGDQDGLCDGIDRCDLSPGNPQAEVLAGLMNQQCPLQEKKSELCSQQQDVDHDGLGNACDADADGDGFDNDVEMKRGSDPLDAASVPQDAKPNPEPTPDPADPSLPGDSSTPSKGNSILAAGCQLQPIQGKKVSNHFYLLVGMLALVGLIGTAEKSRAQALVSEKRSANSSILTSPSNPPNPHPKSADSKKSPAG